MVNEVVLDLTNMANTDDWLRATKDLTITAYIEPVSPSLLGEVRPSA
jgi:hypothetical protein